MNCQVCGAELVPGAQFCGSCGAPQAAPTAQTPMPPPIGGAGTPPGPPLPPYPEAGPDGAEPPSGSSKKGLLWGAVAAVVVVLLGVGAFLAFGGDDDDDTASGPTTSAPPSTTSTTEAVEVLGLAAWVEESDDICSDASDDLADIPGATIEDAAEALPEVISVLEAQLEDIEALAAPDDEPQVDDFLALLADQLAFVEALDEAIQEGGDPEEVFDDAAEDGDDLSGDLQDLADDLEFEYCGQGVDDDPTPPTTSGGDDEPFSYGDDPELDALWDACEAGSAEACDDLWGDAPSGSEYEEFGFSCGGVVPEGEAQICSEVLGDDPAPPDGDAFTYGDDPVLDALWDACDDGDGQACDDLYWDSPIDSEYETFGDTCGYRFSENDAPLSCVDAI